MPEDGRERSTERAVGAVTPSARAQVIADLARSISDSVRGRDALVAVDGVGGSGKTTFADELAVAIRTHAVTVVHADDHLRPAAVRHARGRFSPEGFWLDTYDHARLIQAALEPVRCHAHSTPDRARRGAGAGPATRTLVLVEGTFLLRRELRATWDYSVFLDVPLDEAARRMHVRAGAPLDDRLLARYLGAQRIYFRSDAPWSRADVVLDHADLDHPQLIDPARSAAAAVGRTDRTGRVAP